MPVAQSRIATATEQTHTRFRMIAFMASDGKVCLRPRSGKQYSLQRAVAQLGSALEWGSRGPGFKSRRPDFALCMSEDENRHECCFCAKSVLSPELVTLVMFAGEAREQDAAQRVFTHKKCLRDRVSKSVPLLSDTID